MESIVLSVRSIRTRRLGVADTADFLSFLTNAGGTANWSFKIPSAPALVDLEFSVQGVVADPSANLGGMVITNAAKGKLGLRWAYGPGVAAGQ